MVFVPHRLAYFTQHNALQLHPCMGAAIKDTRTKSRGRVDVGEGGGTGWGGWRGQNADNCN